MSSHQNVQHYRNLSNSSQFFRLRRFHVLMFHMKEIEIKFNFDTFHPVISNRFTHINLIAAYSVSVMIKSSLSSLYVN